MYNFEVISEYHLSQELLVQYSDDFLKSFTSTLQDPDVKVKVASLKTTTSFLSSIDDEEVVLKYKGMMEGLLDIVIIVLQQDETQGQISLESMTELTETHGEIWVDCVPKLIYVTSEIMKNKDFEEATRQAALEIIGTLAENMAAILRKSQEELKTHIFPAIALMMTEVTNEDDIEAWY